MKTETNEKTYSLELTEVELYAITDGIGEASPEAVMNGNDISLFMDMDSDFATQHPHLTKEIFAIARNYTIMNYKLEQFQSPLSWIISKAQKVSETI